MATPFQAVNPQENRLWEALSVYTEQDVKYRVNNPLGSGNDKEAHRLKLEYFQDLLKVYKRRLNKPEKATRVFLRNEIRKLKVKTNPTLSNYLLYGWLSRFLLNTFLSTRRTVWEQRQKFEQFEKAVGHEQNLINLSTQLKQAGFTQNVDHIVQKMLEQGLPKFHVRYNDIKHPTTDFVLHFTKIPNSNTYIFEKFDTAARPSWEQVNRLDTPSKWLSFSLLGQETFSAREAANLINGRSVCKGENLWVTLDKTNPHNPYKSIHFNIESALSQLPLPKMNTTEMKNLVNALQRGDTKEIIFDINGNTTSCRLYAHPTDQSIRVIDTNDRIIDIKQANQQKLQQSQKAAEILTKSQANVIRGNFRKSIK